MEALIYTANGLYLASYFVQDMLRLRCLTVVAAACLAAYFGAQPDPLMTVICWNVFFVALNLLQIGRILRSGKQPEPKTTGADDTSELAAFDLLPQPVPVAAAGAPDWKYPFRSRISI